jgi:hypothetical protein
MGNEVFSKGIRWVIGNGHSTSFWHDTWVGNGPLREVIHGPIPPFEESFCVVDVIEGVGGISQEFYLLFLRTFVTLLGRLVCALLAIRRIALLGILLMVGLILVRLII